MTWTTLWAPLVCAKGHESQSSARCWDEREWFGSDYLWITSLEAVNRGYGRAGAGETLRPPEDVGPVSGLQEESVLSERKDVCAEGYKRFGNAA